MNDKIVKFFDINDVDYDIVDDQPKKQEKVIKGKTLFDHIKAITQEPYNLNYFKELNEQDKKTFSIYMINRFISMNFDWLDLVNYAQQFTQFMSLETVYKFYSNIIPTRRIFLKYIKSTKQQKYNDKLIELFTNHYQTSKKNVNEYIEILLKTPSGTNEIKEICRMYAHDEKEIKKMLK